MIGGTVMVTLSMILLGWTSEFVGLFVPNDEEKRKSVTIVIAVLSIYVLDFAVNAGMLGTPRQWWKHGRDEADSAWL